MPADRDADGRGRVRACTAKTLADLVAADLVASAVSARHRRGYRPQARGQNHRDDARAAAAVRRGAAQPRLNRGRWLGYSTLMIHSYIVRDYSFSLPSFSRKGASFDYHTNCSNGVIRAHCMNT